MANISLPTERDHAIQEIEQLRLELRHDLKFALHRHDGLPCYVVEDPLAGSFYRIGAAEFAFLSELDGRATLADAVARTANALGENAFTTEEATAICQWLLESGLASTGDSRGASLLVERAVRLREQAFLRKANPLYLRLPLVNPDRLLRFLSPLAALAFNGPALLVWLAMLFAAGLTLVRQWPEFSQTVSYVYLQHHWLWITGAWVAIKVLHELAHGIVCRRFGGQVPEGGLYFIFFAPVPYVDVTAAWRFGSKWQRIATSAAGVYLELFLASLAVLIWTYTSSEAIKTVAQSVAVASGATTLLFNLNVLMRFDGYYILVDLLEMPNLYQRGAQYVDYLFRRYVLGISMRSPLAGTEHVAFARLYALASYGWRWLVSIGMMAGAVIAFGEPGWILAAVCLVTWIVLPAWRMARDAVLGSARSPARPWRFAAFAAASFLLAAWGLTMTWPERISCAAVVDYASLAVVRAASPGFVRQIHVRSGQSVQAGDPLVTLENVELQGEYDDLLVVREGILFKRQRDLITGELATYQSRLNELAIIERQIAELDRKLKALTVRSPIAGRVISADLPSTLGRYVALGDEVLSVGDDAALEVILCVAPRDLPGFQEAAGKPADLWLWGGETLSVEVPTLDPRATRSLPHPAMAATAGGTMPVRVVPASENSNADIELIEPCVTGRLPLRPLDLAAFHPGQRGDVSLYRTTDTIAVVLWKRWNALRLVGN